MSTQKESWHKKGKIKPQFDWGKVFSLFLFPPLHVCRWVYTKLLNFLTSFSDFFSFDMVVLKLLNWDTLRWKLSHKKTKFYFVFFLLWLLGVIPYLTFRWVFFGIVFIVYQWYQIKTRYWSHSFPEIPIQHNDSTFLMVHY